MGGNSGGAQVRGAADADKPEVGSGSSAGPRANGNGIVKFVNISADGMATAGGAVPGAS